MGKQKKGQSEFIDKSGFFLIHFYAVQGGASLFNRLILNLIF